MRKGKRAYDEMKAEVRYLQPMDGGDIGVEHRSFSEQKHNQCVCENGELLLFLVQW